MLSRNWLMISLNRMTYMECGASAPLWILLLKVFCPPFTQFKAARKRRTPKGRRKSCVLVCCQTSLTNGRCGGCLNRHIDLYVGGKFRTRWNASLPEMQWSGRVPPRPICLPRHSQTKLVSKSVCRIDCKQKAREASNVAQTA